MKGKETNPVLLTKPDGIQLDMHVTKLDWQQNFLNSRWKGEEQVTSAVDLFGGRMAALLNKGH